VAQITNEQKNFLIALIKTILMIVQHKTDGRHGIFFVKDEDDIAAEMVYNSTSKNQMIIEHTEVDESLRGQNVGIELVHAGVEYARQHGRSFQFAPLQKRFWIRR
jgi:predicted GNAT family acetyltransferase